MTEAFFDEVPGGYRVNKMLRELCVFAQHDIGANPPASPNEPPDCRNLLIYLQPELQNVLMPLFQF